VTEHRHASSVISSAAPADDHAHSAASGDGLVLRGTASEHHLRVVLAGDAGESVPGLAARAPEAGPIPEAMTSFRPIGSSF
jgi:hypothetical protein